MSGPLDQDSDTVVTLCPVLAFVKKRMRRLIVLI
jgi:hypothetical protein